MDDEVNLLSEYLNWRVNRIKPVTLDVQIAIFKTEGYIFRGLHPHELPTFKQWKLLYHK